MLYSIGFGETGVFFWSIGVLMMLEQLACYASIHSQARSIKILKTSRHSYQYMLLHIFILGRDITGGEPLFVTFFYPFNDFLRREKSWKP